VLTISPGNIEGDRATLRTNAILSPCCGKLRHRHRSGRHAETVFLQVPYICEINGHHTLQMSSAKRTRIEKSTKKTSYAMPASQLACHGLQAKPGAFSSIDGRPERGALARSREVTFSTPRRSIISASISIRGRKACSAYCCRKLIQLRSTRQFPNRILTHSGNSLAEKDAIYIPTVC
jgi:hypothetical protein